MRSDAQFVRAFSEGRRVLEKDAVFWNRILSRTVHKMISIEIYISFKYNGLSDCNPSPAT